MSNTFEDWIAHIFDHPVVETERYWDLINEDIRWDYSADDSKPVQEVLFLTRAFENAEAVFAGFSDGQINQALWYQAMPGSGELIYSVIDETVPFSNGLRCVHSFYNLYEQLFQKRCTPHMSSMDIETNKLISPLNSICYMWYDIITPILVGYPDDAAREILYQACLEGLEKILSLNNIACKEAALHGLGHWNPEQAAEIIDRFLADNPVNTPNVTAELRNYAHRARAGYIR